ncbi:MAG: glycosyltransferase family 9 protein [Elusimicrobiota bacterium]|nr:glycosyltransferase family 9 protein [Endomicrobiia bacterium]MDW8166546.1 glycosyltransferase family 9 protein [Elusimicrobiota bacterium]
MPDKHMGNLIVSLPAIKSVECFLENKVKGIIVDESYKEILLAFFDNTKIIPYTLRKVKSKIWLIKDFLKFIKEIRSLNPTLSIDYEGRTVGAFISFLSGAKYRVGFSNADKSYYYNIKISPNQYLHKYEYYISIPLKLGIPIINNLKPTIKNEWEVSLKKFFSPSKEAIKHDKIVCIHPGAGKIYKKWLPQKFALVADYLVEKGYIVVFIGSKKDKDDILKVRSYMKHEALDLSTKISIGELMALFKTIKFYIGNDSGPMHLASLFGIPIITLFGPSNEKRWKPIGEKVIVLRGNERCDKCKGKNCEKDFQCITSISPYDVIEKIREFL